MDSMIVKRLNEFSEKYKKLEDDNKFDDALQEIENALLYLTTKLEGGMNFVDKEILSSYTRDYQVVRRTMRTSKRLYELEQRVDNLSFQVGKISKDFENKTEFK